LHAVGRGRVGQSFLQAQCGKQRIGRVVEGAMGAIPAHFHDGSVVVLYGGAHDRIVARERKLHALMLAIPQARAAFDIGEQECRDAG